MSHLGARVLRVLQDDRPYQLRDNEGKPISRAEARRLILINYQVTEDVRRERRRRNPAKRVYIKSEGMAVRRTNEAATAPQPVKTTAIPGVQFN